MRRLLLMPVGSSASSLLHQAAAIEAESAAAVAQQHLLSSSAVGSTQPQNQQPACCSEQAAAHQASSSSTSTPQQQRHELWQPVLHRRCLHSAALGAGASQAAAMQPRTTSTSSSSSSAEKSKAITRLIRDVSGLGELQLLVAQHSASFNAINIAAAFTRAQALAATNTAEQQQQHLHADEALLLLLLEQLDTLWQQQLQAATPRELASVMLACSKLPHLSPQLWQSTLAALLQQVDGINSQDASSAAYALAVVAAAASRTGLSVPGLSSPELTDAMLTLAGRVWRLMMSSGDDRSKQRHTSSSSGPPEVSAQAVSNVLWSLARLGILLTPDRLSHMLEGLATPQMLGTAKPLALVNTLWAVSELMQLPGWSQSVSSSRLATHSTGASAAATAAANTTTSSSSSSSGGSRQQRQQQQLLHIIPAALLADQQLDKVARSSSQAVSNTVLALSRFASGPLPHLLDVPTAQACIRRLLQGPTAAALGEWNAQDVGNAVFAVAQVGAMEPSFLQAVIDSAHHWLPEAGPATVIQVALGLARLKHKHCSELLEALVMRGKHLLLQQNHHRHPSSSSSESGSGSSSDGTAADSDAGSTGDLQADSDAINPELLRHSHNNQQQQQHMCECLATDLSWSIATLNNEALAREVEQLIRASGIKQESSLHPKNARRLWIVHAWLVRHKLAGGHGLSRLLTEAQLAFCAAASRHTHRVTPPPST